METLLAVRKLLLRRTEAVHQFPGASRVTDPVGWLTGHNGNAPARCVSSLLRRCQHHSKNRFLSSFPFYAGISSSFYRAIPDRGSNPPHGISRSSTPAILRYSRLVSRSASSRLATLFARNVPYTELSASLRRRICSERDMGIANEVFGSVNDRWAD